MTEVSKVNNISRTNPFPNIFPGSYTVALSECNGSQRSTTAADNCRKRRNQYNERGSHPYTRQRIGANSRNMPDVYTVDNAIKQIDKLCSHCRECILKISGNIRSVPSRSSYLLFIPNFFF